MEDKNNFEVTEEHEGIKLDKKLTINIFRGILIEMLKGYPVYVYHGFFEKKFGEEAKHILSQLKEDDLIKISYNERNLKCYSLTKKGVDFAISMIQLKYMQETKYFSRILIWLTYIIVTATIGMLIFSFSQSFISLWFLGFVKIKTLF
jgi:hypothetical protein